MRSPPSSAAPPGHARTLCRRHLVMANDSGTRCLGPKGLPACELAGQRGSPKPLARVSSKCLCWESGGSRPGAAGAHSSEGRAAPRRERGFASLPGTPDTVKLDELGSSGGPSRGVGEGWLEGQAEKGSGSGVLSHPSEPVPLERVPGRAGLECFTPAPAPRTRPYPVGPRDWRPPSLPSCAGNPGQLE